MLTRKEDAREKIQLGGLVKKAGLEHEAKSVILGLLTEAKKRLDGMQGVELREKWRMIGDKVFNQSQVIATGEMGTENHDLLKKKKGGNGLKK